MTIKTLRFYHEAELIRPVSIDADSGYRYYSVDQLSMTRAVRTLRDLGFSVAEIVSILDSQSGNETLVELLEQRKAAILQTLRQDRERLKKLEQILAMERLAEQRDRESTHEIRELQLNSQLIASIKHRGQYSDSGKIFSKLARQYGRYLVGKPMILCWDSEYREDDANFEVAFPVRDCKPKAGSEVCQLHGGVALSLLHTGPYDQLYNSYRKLMVEATRRGWSYQIPTREVYHKGPGMIFAGNPQKYVTEIQLVAEKD